MLFRSDGYGLGGFDQRECTESHDPDPYTVALRKVAEAIVALRELPESAEPARDTSGMLVRNAYHVLWKQQGGAYSDPVKGARGNC